MSKFLKSLAVSALLVVAAGPASAQSFDCLTSNSATSCAQGEPILTWTWDGSHLTMIASSGSAHAADVPFDLGAGVADSFNGGLRISETPLAGINLRSLFSGQSEAFVTPPVPEPGTYVLMLAGLGALAFVARRRRLG